MAKRKATEVALKWIEPGTSIIVNVPKKSLTSRCQTLYREPYIIGPSVIRLSLQLMQHRMPLDALPTYV